MKRQGSSLNAAAIKGVLTPDEVITPPNTIDYVAPAIQLEFSHDVKFAGTLEDCNRALGSLFYRGDPNWNSANKDKDVVTFRVTELLTAGSGVPTTDVRVMYINVLSVNDAPVVHVPGTVSVCVCAAWCACARVDGARVHCPFASCLGGPLSEDGLVCAAGIVSVVATTLDLLCVCTRAHESPP